MELIAKKAVDKASAQLLPNEGIVCIIEENHLLSFYSWDSILNLEFKIELSEKTSFVCFHPLQDRFVVPNKALLDTQELSMDVWNYTNQTIEREFFLPLYPLWDGTFTSDGQYLIVGATDKFYAVRWSDGTIANTFPGFDQNISVATHTDNKTIALVGNSESSTNVIITNINTTILEPVTSNDSEWETYWNFWEEHTLYVPFDLTSGAVFSPDGKWMAITHRHPILYSYPELQIRYIFDSSGERISKFSGEERIRQVERWSVPLFSADSQSFICVSPDGVMFIWDVSSGQIQQKIKISDGPVRSLNLSSTGKQLIFIDSADILQVWRLFD